jgi:methionyl-tRNA formyltransferase
MFFLFFASDIFALPILKSLIHEIGSDNLTVVTRPAKPAGRGLRPQPNPILQEAKNSKIQTLIVDSQNDWVQVQDLITSKKPDYCVVAAFGKIIPQKILDLLPQKFINIHPSLLPKYRGPSPIESVLLEGDKTTGLSFIVLTQQMDAGPILWQKEFKISNQNAQELSTALSQIASDNILDALKSYQNNKLKPTPQNDNQATYTHIITKSDGQIDTSDNPQSIMRKIKAFQPWPGVTVKIDKTNIKIIDATTRDDSLVITKIQPEGKRVMTGKDFANGYRNSLTKFPPSVKFN